MSEFINNKSRRIESLLEFSTGIIRGEKGRELLTIHQKAIDNLTPFDVIEVVDKLLRIGISVAEIKRNIGKILNIFYTPLLNHIWEVPDNEGFIYYLMLENRAMEHIMKRIKLHIKTWNKASKNSTEALSAKKQIHDDLLLLQNFELHYSKKENILFPYLEREWKDYRCLSVMWAIHDDIRKSLKKLLQLFDNQQTTMREFNKELGVFFFAVYAIKFREEFILFPVVTETVAADLLEKMHQESFEIGFPLIEQPKKRTFAAKANKPTNNLNYSQLGNTLLEFQTGKMHLKQIEMLINTLPVDITLVDENDRVVFFSNPEHRIFTRSKAIIGRSVQNCHPPDSVHIVNEIVESFRSGRKKKESFWIQMQGKFLLIEYFALHDEAGNFRGTMEVSQDITNLRKLTGEKRLLDMEA